MPQYASQTDYEVYTGRTTTNRLLEAASLRIDELLVGVVYDVDDDHLPTDEAVAAALMAATCEQALWMDEQGDTTGSGAGDTSALASASIGSASYNFGTTDATAKQQRQTSSGASVAPGAIAVLSVEGLLPASAIVRG